MANYYIKTYDSEGKQLLGTDFTTIVKSCSYSGKKFNNALKQHNAKLESLKSIKPFLNDGWALEYEKF